MTYRRARNLDKDLIFAEYFNSEQEVRKNGGVPTDVTFDKGVASFDGVSSVINIHTQWLRPSSGWTIRGIFLFNETTFEYLWGGTYDADFFTYISGTSIISRVNGAGDGGATFSFQTGVFYDIMMTSSGGVISYYLDGTLLGVGTRAASQLHSIESIGAYVINYANVNISLIEFYNRALTAEEVSNLYHDARYVMPNLNRSGLSKILHVNAFDGVARNLLAGDVVGVNLNTSSCGNKDYTTFTNGSAAGFDVTSDGSAYHEAGTADEIIIVSSQKYVVTFNTILNSGVLPFIRLATSRGGSPLSVYHQASNGSNVIVITAIGSDTGVLEFSNQSTVTDYSISQLSVKDTIPDTINTDIEVVKEGHVRVPRFNGLTSTIDCGDYNDLTGDISILAWVKTSNKNSSYGIIGNGQSFLRFGSSDPTKYIVTGSDDTTGQYWAGAISIWNENEYHLVAWVRKANGEAIGIFFDGISRGLAGVVDTPIAGTENITISSSAAEIAGGFFMDGNISEVQIISGLLTPAEISQYYSSTKHLYGK